MSGCPIMVLCLLPRSNTYIKAQPFTIHYSTQPVCQCHNRFYSWTGDHSTHQWFTPFYTFPNLYCVPESCTTANQSSSPTVTGSLSLVCSNTSAPGYIITTHQIQRITWANLLWARGWAISSAGSSCGGSTVPLASSENRRVNTFVERDGRPCDIHCPDNLVIGAENRTRLRSITPHVIRKNSWATLDDDETPVISSHVHICSSVSCYSVTLIAIHVCDEWIDDTE